MCVQCAEVLAAHTPTDDDAPPALAPPLASALPFPSPLQPGPRASKSALNIINKSMSIDLANRGVTAVLLHPGYVRTRMTGGQGLIDVDESVRGLLRVLETAEPLNGAWYDYSGKVVPW